MGRASASLMEKVCTDSVERNPCLFHVKQSPETRCLSSPARGQTFRSGHPNARPVPNARLNLRRRPQDLSCACFSCTTGDQARLAPCSGSSCPNHHKCAGRVNRFRYKTARSDTDSFSIKYNLKSRTALHPAADQSQTNPIPIQPTIFHFPLDISAETRYNAS